MYLLRLDDASEFMDVSKWNRIEVLLDKYSIKPIVGIIPNNQDPNMIDKYKKDEDFWDKVKCWQEKEWTIALHGCNHVYDSNCGGLNPVNYRSEFAGISLEIQKEKIDMGISILDSHGISTMIFFAPSHTFDINTLEALRLKSDIRIISDTIANDIYKSDGFYFIPQQSGRVRNLPFKITTFCYHPNEMTDQDFYLLEKFIKENQTKFSSFSDIEFKDRNLGIYDKILRFAYFMIRLLRNIPRRVKNE
ncbi:DUF2334 domain-containing protein [Brassicibacter mesophilus]|uniref:DUF2334 domain-containing protein n=1 Tax=Brassicibacter mesophilus TaxID=745119 RepID=UPI003D1D69BF